jgi:hypothetical protein
MLAVAPLSISNVQAAPVKVGSYIGNWNAKTSYAAGDLITLDDKTFLSLVAKNKNKNPNSNPKAWQVLGGVGSTGVAGLAGPQGLQGAAGIGFVGPTGADGPAGAQGPKGDTGTPGKDGSPGAIPTHLTPIFVDANGIYVGTLIGTNYLSTVFDHIGKIVMTLTLKNGYLFGLNDNGEFLPFYFDGYENATCSGLPTLLRKDLFFTNNNLVDVFSA